MKTIVFDLDDTLVPEIAYLKSAFREIASLANPDDPTVFDKMMECYHGGGDVFGTLCDEYPILDKDDLKRVYRHHFPDFTAYQVKPVLEEIKSRGHKLGLITDGYSITQRNKIRALGIEALFDKIVVSEEFGSTKPDPRNYEAFHEFGSDEYYYVSDNVNKDFIAPNRLGWKTICLIDAGENIHKQDFNKDLVYLPSIKLQTLPELLTYI
jgi:putative hydrolase of the HAD superfamily